MRCGMPIGSGFDVKALAEDCQLVTQVKGSGAANWRSLETLLASGVDYECRTTVHWHLIDPQRLLLLAQRLQAAGVQRFAVQMVRTASMLDQQLPSSPLQVRLPELWGLYPRVVSGFCIARVTDRPQPAFYRCCPWSGRCSSRNV